MLPQFGYIVAQAGADSRPPPSQLMYTHARSPPPPSSAQQQHQNQPTHGASLANATGTQATYNNAPAQHQNAPNAVPAPSTRHHQAAGTLSSSQSPHRQQHHLYQSQPSVTAPPFTYSTSVTPPVSVNGAATTEYHTQYYSSNYAMESFRPPPPRPSQTQTSAAASPWQPHDPASLSSSIWQAPSPHTMYSSQQPDVATTMPPPAPPPPLIIKQAYEHAKPPPARWDQEETLDAHDRKMLRRLRDCNDLTSWMDREFCEQKDEVYQEKHQALQKELKSLQEGDHALFQERLADLELIRDQTIDSALCFETYQQTIAKQDLDLNLMEIENEFKIEERYLKEVIMLVIDEHRKQIKDDRGNDIDAVDIEGLFEEVYERIQQKKHLRKRTTLANGDRASPAGSRHETSSRGRRLKNTTVAPHNINAPMTAKEEDDVETEYLAMKGMISKRNTTNSRR
ncbi:hypothetical protein BCR42DRAFT_412603 [Absidia repens]|uniref:Sds3-like-domain-containing protein n=1 Tax=Absidia repens TaxID=90262 RepID=A0A1X2IJZ7_9FUNG|nr:hypothetical protein BCR42DRAFT_412603 [Absidia repens]